MITKRDEKGRIQKGNNLTHGLSRTPTYHCWVAMKARCRNKQHPHFQRYGGRGINVCTRWLTFDNFLEDMGKMPKGKTIDRIDVNGDYCKENCRWITIQEQQKNKSNNNEIVGVTFEEDRRKWRADIKNRGVRYFLGRFADLHSAVVARRLAEQKFGYEI